MPEIGKMTQVASKETGEIGFSGECDIPAIRKFKTRASKQTGEKAPKFDLLVNGRVTGAMWDEGEDRNGNQYFRLKFNGYPLDREIYLTAFFEAEGDFVLDYSAARAPKVEAA